MICTDTTHSLAQPCVSVQLGTPEAASASPPADLGGKKEPKAFIFPAPFSSRVTGSPGLMHVPCAPSRARCFYAQHASLRCNSQIGPDHHTPHTPTRASTLSLSVAICRSLHSLSAPSPSFISPSFLMPCHSASEERGGGGGGRKEK